MASIQTSLLPGRCHTGCHNEHPDSTKRDWKVGDVRGVLEIIRPLDRDAARTRTGLRGTFVLMAVVSASLLGLSVLILVAGNRLAAPGQGRGDQAVGREDRQGTGHPEGIPEQRELLRPEWSRRERPPPENRLP